MDDKQNTPHFDAATIRAKRKKVKGIKVSGGGRARGPTHDASTRSSSPKHQRTKSGMVMGEIESLTALILDASASLSLLSH